MYQINYAFNYQNGLLSKGVALSYNVNISDVYLGTKLNFYNVLFTYCCILHVVYVL